MHDHTFTNRIESAFRALAYTHSAEAGGVTLTPHGPRATKPRRLTNAETGLRNSAAEVLRNFITGEIRVPRTRRAGSRGRRARGNIAAKFAESGADSLFSEGLIFDPAVDPDNPTA